MDGLRFREKPTEKKCEAANALLASSMQDKLDESQNSERPRTFYYDSNYVIFYQS